MAGMNLWFRQLELHAGLYRFWNKRTREAAGSARPEQAIFQALANGDAPQPHRLGSDLEGLDRMKFDLMTCTKFKAGEAHNTTSMKNWMGGKYTAKHSDLAAKIKDVADELVAKGLLLSEERKSQPGRKVSWYKQVKWVDVIGDASAEASRMDLMCDAFEN
jgi:hypothetical protein